jgi:hypothetical protein
MCFSLTLPDDQLADMAVAGMLPAVREKLFGMEFENLGQLSQNLSLMSNQAYEFKKDTRFAKHHDIADIYNQFLEKADQVEDFDDDEEVSAAEIMWGKEPLTANQRWIKQTKGTYDFRHCWNEGLKLPTLKNCPECSDKYFEYRQETANRRSVHERIGRIHPNDDRRQKIEVIDHPRKRQANQRWADQEEEEREYIWQEGQWCPPGLRKSQKRRVQRLRNRELKQAGIQRKQVWRPRGKPEGSGHSAPACMVYFLPNELVAPANQVVQEEAFPEDERLERVMAQLVLAKQATFDKPAKNRHMRPLHLKGYVNGKPLTKMFVDGGAAVNVMLYTTFRKLGMGPGDLTPTSIILNDFAGNPSDTKGCVHVDLMIGSKTFLTTFFVIEGKKAYSLLLGRDWIHANCCIPSTMHQQLIQWVDDDIEVVQADDSVSVANVETAFWEYQGIDCFSGKDWGEGPVEPVSSDQQPIQAVGSYSNF